MNTQRSQSPAFRLQPLRIAVFRALFLGDQICATPALRALRQQFPNAEITLIGLPWADELVQRLPYVDRLLPFAGYPGINEVPTTPERTAAFLEEARAYGYDLAIQMHGSGAISNGFVAALSARATLGYRSGEDNRLTLSMPFPEDEHEIVRWLKLVKRAGEALGVAVPPPAENLRTDFPVLPADRIRAEALLGGADAPLLVALHVGAKDPERRWPVEKFAAVGDTLAQQYGARIVLTGSAGERELTAAVSAVMRAPVLDLAGASDLGSFGALIERLDLLVTNDTGASHVAAALGTPSVIMFGPSRPDNWAPFDQERHRVIDALDHAAPGTTLADALRDLPVATVLAECLSVIDAVEPLREAAVSA